MKIGVEDPPGVQNFSSVAVADAAGHVQQLAQRDAERGLVLPGALDVPGQAEDAEAGGALGAHVGEPVRSR